MLGHDPPIHRCSTEATRFPSLASVQARNFALSPVPKTIGRTLPLMAMSSRFSPKEHSKPTQENGLPPMEAKPYRVYVRALPLNAQPSCVEVMLRPERSASARPAKGTMHSFDLLLRVSPAREVRLDGVVHNCE